MKFKTRVNTAFIYIHPVETGGMSAHELRIEAKRRGELELEGHYYVQQDGAIEEGREPHVEAHYDLENHKESIHIFVNAKSLKTMSDALQFSLDQLIETLSSEYEDSQVIYLKK